MGHTVSILRDIMVPLLRIPIATGFHQEWPDPYGIYDQLMIPPVGQSHC